MRDKSWCSGICRQPQTHTTDASSHCQVIRGKLPLQRPAVGMCLGNLQPRVYLPIRKTGQTKCLCCGANYALMA